MMKRIGLLSFTVLFLLGNAFVVQAAVCSNSPDGVHHFSVHKAANAGYSVDLGTHEYLYGYDQNNNPIYKNDCRRSERYQYCQYICSYCNKVNDTEGSHSHYVKTVHSINHN